MPARPIPSRSALCYGQVFQLMRLLLAFSLAALIPLAMLPAEQNDKHVDSAKPNVNISPRTRPPVVDATESITDRRSDIRVDTTLVLIPVSVTDSMSRFVIGLDKENFQLSEDKVDQEITRFRAKTRHFQWA